MSVVDDLRAQIDAGRIIFDNAQAGQAAKLRRELLGQNAGTKVTTALQTLALEVSRLQRIRISSIIRSGSSSRHVTGRAFDVGNEEVAGALLPQIATDERVNEFGIDEIIFDARVAGEANRNKWNYDRGQKHNYDDGTLREHRNHIHFAVMG
ncbi:MAG TPA: hypothetical protein VF656_14485 [Pyrinomonadaceae bacterium]|jgi:hypothetical protein